MFQSFELNSKYINKNKLNKINDVLKEYRINSKTILNIQLFNLFKNGNILKFVDTKKITNSKLSQRYLQNINTQIKGILDSYFSNRQNDLTGNTFNCENQNFNIFYSSNIKNDINGIIENGIEFLSQKSSIDLLKIDELKYEITTSEFSTSSINFSAHCKHDEDDDFLYSDDLDLNYLKEKFGITQKNNKKISSKK